jgi:hypothetical protein
MTLGLRLVSNRRAVIAACCIAALAALFAGGGSVAQTEAGVGPDVTVFAFTDIGNYGSANGFVGYSVGTRSCNRGDVPLNWCDQSSGCAAGAGTEDHPVIAQNLYRLKNGRFQQIGMSWLKHGFLSTNSFTAGCAGAAGQSCQSPPAGSNQLGIGCTDPYGASLNGGRPLGRRSEVDGTTGVFPFPPGGGGASSTVYDQRIKVPTAEVDSTLNPGALFWVEAQYIASDDASSGNSLNNASYRRVTVGTSPNYTLSMTGSFFEKQAAIFAWLAQDPSVALVNVDVPGSIVQRFHVGRKVTDLGGGLWHYEFAIHNQNSDRSARSFSVQFPATANFTNVGFKDIEHHSGEPYAVDDWVVSSSGGLISWSTDTFATNANANALRFATMFNFWFDSDQPPTSEVLHTIGLFKPGTPSSVEFTISDELFADGFETGNTSHWNSNLNALRPARSRVRKP